jgi:hypothetical protein
MKIYANNSKRPDLMIGRHNMVQGRVVEAIVKHRNLSYEEIHQNKTIRLDKFLKLRQVNIDAYNCMRPNVYFWTEIEDEEKLYAIRKLYVIEFEIPFGRGTEDNYENTLKYVNKFKITKYKGMMNRLNKELKKVNIEGVKFRAEFRAIIVSSLEEFRISQFIT